MSERHARSQPPSQHPSAGASSPIEEGVLDLEGLRDRAGGDEDLVMELLQDFLGRPVGLDELRAAAAAQNYREMALMSHRLKGALLALGATRAASAASTVEKHASRLESEGATLPPDSHSLLSRALVDLEAQLAKALDAMRVAVSRSATAVTLTGSSA